MSTFTSDRYRLAWRSLRARGEAGFSLIEMILGLSLALTVVLGVAPVWISFQSVAVEEGDKTIWNLQARVAGARLEQDLRRSSVAGCPFQSPAAVLQATASQVVLLVPAGGSATPVLVEWELVSGSLMRRWGPCPVVRPATFSHSLYSDNKTMLEGVNVGRSRFDYLVAGSLVSAPAADEPPLVDRVTLTVTPRGQGPGAGDPIGFSEGVGR